MRSAALTLLATLATSPLAAQQLAIHHIDVGQGDATLVVTPNGSTLLIDAGLNGQGDEVHAFLQAQGHTSLDAFLVTHYDRDHYGGIDEVTALGATVGAWYERGERDHIPDKITQTQFMEYDAVAVNEIRLMPGNMIDLDPEVTITVVASNGHVRGAVGHY